MQELLKDKYELETRLETAQLANDQLEEKHKAEQEDIQHSCEEKIRLLQEDKVLYTVEPLLTNSPNKLIRTKDLVPTGLVNTFLPLKEENLYYSKK